MGKSTILLYAGIVAAGAALSLLAWFAGTGKLPLAVPSIPALTASVALLATVPAVLIRFADE